MSYCDVKTGREAGIKMCEAIGICPDLVTRIEMTFTADNFATAVVTMGLTRKTIDDIVVIIKGEIKKAIADADSRAGI